MGNNGPLDSERARYARTFNPYQLMENCFFVALARMLSIDSTTVAVWAGEDEMKTANVGIPISKQLELLNTLNARTGSRMKLINLDEDEYYEDYRAVNGGEGPTIEKILILKEKHGLKGRCFTLEFINSQTSMGHYINLQAGKLVDFQSCRTDVDINQALELGNLRIIIGDGILTGNTIVPLPPIDRLVATIRNDWDQSRGQWKFHVYHRGHWGKGWCLDIDQQEANPPKWRRDLNQVQKLDSPWLGAADNAEYSFDSKIWTVPRLSSCNKVGGWGGPCLDYAAEDREILAWRSSNVER